MEFLVSHFSDLEIISLEESQQVAAIKYETEYRELLQIFFTILHLNEKSDRVLELTLKILTINPAHFTVWQYRRECLLALGKDLQEELYFIDEFAGDNPKNYQIWYHRRALVTLIGPSSVEAELAFTENVFHEDAKNYHAWAHRLFLVTAFNKYDDELDLISVLLEADPRNNSAWNHRWLVQFGRFVDKAAVSLERIASEIAFCFSMLLVVKNNESGWNYLTGILRAFPKQSMVSIKARCLEMMQTVPKAADCVGLLATLVDICELEATEEAASMGFLYCNRLAVIDSMRIKYWTQKGLAIQN